MVKLSVIKSECGTAQLILPLFILFSAIADMLSINELIHLNDLLL